MSFLNASGSFIYTYCICNEVVFINHLTMQTSSYVDIQ